MSPLPVRTSPVRGPQAVLLRVELTQPASIRCIGMAEVKKSRLQLASGLPAWLVQKGMFCASAPSVSDEQGVLCHFGPP